jgi:hypothetical protein
VRKNSIPDTGSCTPFQLRSDRCVSDLHCATTSNHRTVERGAITDVQIDIFQSRDRIWQASHVRHIEDVTRSGRYAISDSRRQHRVLHRPGFDD